MTLASLHGLLTSAFYTNTAVNMDSELLILEETHLHQEHPVFLIRSCSMVIKHRQGRDPRQIQPVGKEQGLLKCCQDIERALDMLWLSVEILL